MQFEDRLDCDQSSSRDNQSSSSRSDRGKLNPNAQKLTRIAVRANNLKNNLQRVDQISCREGLDSIVSGSGTQGERGDQSYINFKAMHNKHSKVSQLGKISGIGGVGDAQRGQIPACAPLLLGDLPLVVPVAETILHRARAWSGLGLGSLGLGLL